MRKLDVTGWIRRCVLGAALVAAVAPAGAQNLITNGAFDHGIEGWTDWASKFEIVYHPDVGSTLAGGSGQGCLEIRLSCWEGGGMGPVQSVPVTGGTTYTLGGSMYLPDFADNLATWGAVFVCWLDTDSHEVGTCQVAGSTVTQRGGWMERSADIAAPAGAVTAQVELMVATPNLENETRPGVAYFDDIVLTPVGVPTNRQELFIPAAASAHGRNGTLWTTTGWFANRTAVPLELQGAFLPQGKDNSEALSSLTALGTVPAWGFLEVQDLVARLGATGKTGGIYLTATARGDDLPDVLLVATSYTFTPNPNGSGSYGQGVRAVGRGNGAQVVTIPGIYQNDAHRTNIGVLNTSGVALDLIVSVYGNHGSSLGSANWTLQPYEQKQSSLTALGVNAASGGYVVINQRGTGGSFRSYATVVDQNSGDAVYTPGS